MVISAQWELVLGNTYGYTVLSAFGFFYGGFGAIITPLFGVAASYGTDTAEYNNALGYFVLSEFSKSKTRTFLIFDSVGGLEFLLPAWLSSTVSEAFQLGQRSEQHLFPKQSGLHWNFLHGADGIHLGGSLVFRSSGWSSGHLHRVKEDRWRFCVSLWIARLLYCSQLDVPTINVLFISDGRHQSLFST